MLIRSYHRGLFSKLTFPPSRLFSSGRLRYKNPYAGQPEEANVLHLALAYMKVIVGGTLCLGAFFYYLSLKSMEQRGYDGRDLSTWQVLKRMPSPKPYRSEGEKFPIYESLSDARTGKPTAYLTYDEMVEKQFQKLNAEDNVTVKSLPVEPPDQK